MFEFSLWALREFWKGAGHREEEFPTPTTGEEARKLVVQAGLLEEEESIEVIVMLYSPKDWKPMPEGLELFQRDANGEYVRQEPRSEGNYIEPYAPPKEVSEEEETCDCGCRSCHSDSYDWLFGKGWEERDD